MKESQSDWDSSYRPNLIEDQASSSGTYHQLRAHEAIIRLSLANGIQSTQSLHEVLKTIYMLKPQDTRLRIMELPSLAQGPGSGCDFSCSHKDFQFE